MIPEAELVGTDLGLVPKGDGWFVLNAREARWRDRGPRRGAVCTLDIEPEFDPSAAYALFGFNPAWGGPNIMGRYYRVGVKLDF